MVRAQPKPAVKPVKPSRANRPKEQLKQRYIALTEGIARRERERQEDDEEEAAAPPPARRPPAADQPKRTPSALVEPSNEIPTPPHNFRVNPRTRCLEVRVTLHKVPPEYVTCDATDTHFYLDTLKWTKKWKIDEDYPDGIRVRSAACQAEMQKNGTLLCTLPIDELPPTAKEKQQKITSGKRKERLLRFTERGVVLKQVRAKRREKRAAGLDELSAEVGADDPKAVPHTGRQKPRKLVDDKDELLAMAQAAWETTESKLAARQDQWWKLQKEQEEATLARLIAKAQTSKNRRHQLEQFITAKRKRIEDMERAHPPLAAGDTAGTRPKLMEDEGKQPKRVSFGGVHEFKEGRKRKKPTTAGKKGGSSKKGSSSKKGGKKSSSASGGKKGAKRSRK